MSTQKTETDPQGSWTHGDLRWWKSQRRQRHK